MKVDLSLVKDVRPLFLRKRNGCWRWSGERDSDEWVWFEWRKRSTSPPEKVSGIVSALLDYFCLCQLRFGAFVLDIWYVDGAVPEEGLTALRGLRESVASNALSRAWAAGDWLSNDSKSVQTAIKGAGEFYFYHLCWEKGPGARWWFLSWWRSRER